MKLEIDIGGTRGAVKLDGVEIPGVVAMQIDIGVDHRPRVVMEVRADEMSVALEDPHIELRPTEYRVRG